MSRTYSDVTDFDGMPAAATFGESILRAQVEIARQMKNPDQYRKRAMYRAIAKVISDSMSKGSN